VVVLLCHAPANCSHCDTQAQLVARPYSRPAVDTAHYSVKSRQLVCLPCKALAAVQRDAAQLPSSRVDECRCPATIYCALLDVASAASPAAAAAGVTLVSAAAVETAASVDDASASSSVVLRHRQRQLDDVMARRRTSSCTCITHTDTMSPLVSLTASCNY